MNNIILRQHALVIDSFTYNLLHLKLNDFIDYLLRQSYVDISLISNDILMFWIRFKTVETYSNFKTIIDITKKMSIFTDLKIQISEISNFDKIYMFNTRLLHYSEQYMLNGYLKIVDMFPEYFSTVLELSQQTLVNKSIRKVRLINKALNKYFIRDLARFIKDYLF